MKRFVTFGEIMARFAAPGFLRLRQALPGSVDVTFAGAEANVAASLAILGADASFVTALPDNPLAEACLATLRGLAIDLSYVLTRDTGRLGLYFLEAGANQRPGHVIYDREHSTISVTPADAYDWDSVFIGAGWLHVTGVTPAISQLAAESALAAVEHASRRGLSVSFDVNFRAKLWRWEPGTPPRELAGRTLQNILPHVSLLIAGPNQADLLGLGSSPDASVDLDLCATFARQVVGAFPNIRRVATTLRQSHSASHNDYGAMLYDADSDRLDFSPRRDGEYRPYEIRNIVDRVGGGDAFAAGLIFALSSEDYATTGDALDFATAAACLAHSIPGDVNFSTRAEIDALRAGSTAGRVVR
jgi:2-dehydro-3-deoxygluconokinase